MNMDSELSFFCLLVKQGSLASTARELNLTPPAVSRRLSAMEDRLGVRLLNRTTRRVSLTHEGEVYFEVRMSDAWVWDMYRPARFVKNVRVLTFKDVNIEEVDKPDLRLPEGSPFDG